MEWSRYGLRVTGYGLRIVDYGYLVRGGSGCSCEQRIGTDILQDFGEESYLG